MILFEVVDDMALHPVLKSIFSIKAIAACFLAAFLDAPVPKAIYSRTTI